MAEKPDGGKSSLVSSRGGREPMPESLADGLAYEVMGTPLWAYVALLAALVHESQA